jgi:hypothetical protein
MESAMPTVTLSPGIPAIIAAAKRYDSYSIIKIQAIPELMFEYCNKEMAYHHYESLKSHAYRVAIVWQGMVYRSC